MTKESVLLRQLIPSTFRYFSLAPNSGLHKFDPGCFVHQINVIAYLKSFLVHRSWSPIYAK